MAFPVDRIRDACRDRNLTLAELERALGFGNGVIAKWSKLKTSPPLDRLVAIAHYLDVPVSRITGEESMDRPVLDDDELKFALWGGKADTITDEELEEVRRFAAFIAERRLQKEGGDR